jgi:NAD+ synthase (glutamine-hydrolysing)
MKLLLAQVNPLVGDLPGNLERCLAAAEYGRTRGADMVILPEMALPGCPPRDILYDSSFIAAAAEAVSELAQRARRGPALVLGSVVASGQHPAHHPGLYNAALLLDKGTVRRVAAKRLLRSDDVFHESRWFIPGALQPPLRIGGRRVGFLLGEDAPAGDEPPDLWICLAASPYTRQVWTERLAVARQAAVPLVYVNLCGGNDELIYDGHSFVTDGKGTILACLPGFEEINQLVDLEPGQSLPPAQVDLPGAQPEQEVFQALVLGVRDFCRKNGLKRAFLGLSGGIDSALVAIIAAAALGADQVTALAIPSRYTAARSTASARELAATLGICFEVRNLEPLHRAVEDDLGDLLAQANASEDAGTAAENIQARLRAMILMGYVNRYGGILLNTSNKTELTLGYGTLYGDLAGSLCPIADLTKPEVFQLVRWLTTQPGQRVPDFILERPPSAELKPDQLDPFDYAAISPQVEALVQENRSSGAMRRSEHKRWQAGVILKVSPKAFGSGRLIPITRR